MNKKDFVYWLIGLILIFIGIRLMPKEYRLETVIGIILILIAGWVWGYCYSKVKVIDGGIN